VVTVGFVVEGDSEKVLAESALLRRWLKEECGLEVIDPVVNVSGNGNMCNRKIGVYVEKMRRFNPDKIVVLADLDPEKCAPCITARRMIIGDCGADLVVIARKALESWFLADTEAMRRWAGDEGFVEPVPETIAGMPWDSIRQIGRDVKGRGPGGSKPRFAKHFINNHGFDVRNAAAHPDCPSAKYFVEKLCALGDG